VLAVFLTAFLGRFPWARTLRPFFAVGVLGAYTTFSALAVETATLVKDGDAALGVGYTVASVVAGLLVVATGIKLGGSRLGGIRLGRALRTEH
jgi:CrcB protein